MKGEFALPSELVLIEICVGQVCSDIEIDPTTEGVYLAEDERFSVDARFDEETGVTSLLMKVFTAVPPGQLSSSNALSMRIMASTGEVIVEFRADLSHYLGRCPGDEYIEFTPLSFDAGVFADAAPADANSDSAAP